ncbi:peptidase M23-like protein [Ruminiclostridium sufflavum DSM 19573]|uniref:Peptidase M23-like protein n=1 Tax=Ruminiclostridium sufflavum DSM 19573 TaxID=1121337 RepID=A0A318XUE9_9FIRM|nr:M23 family metallopeptidase [Ruminiclostridium sufflavum]PYG86567.1 peptidase M23-like protein [Ruminiclostridium sufflavum DSM 19573]
MEIIFLGAKSKLKRKILLWCIGAGLPVLLFLSVLFIACLMPLLIFGGEDIYKSPVTYDQYYGAESGGAAFKLSGKGEYFFPVDTEKIIIDSGFGMRMHPILKTLKMHTGIDIDCETGTIIYAAESGTVSFAGESGGYGNLIKITHQNGYVTYYAHLSKILVPESSIVDRGQVIAYAGSTGLSTGPHLHFEVRKNNEPVDPSTYLGLVRDIPDVLPDDLKYIEINTDNLKKWLNARNSILADEPYTSGIVNAAKEYNVNPILLFAITGQEQSFVPRTGKNAVKIANNPFNVYHSWYEYNTNVNDSAKIAANTIIKLSKGRPESVNPLAWINLRGGAGGYAEDPNWWVGVSMIFQKIKSSI